jgi:hypothetical protein
MSGLKDKQNEIIGKAYKCYLEDLESNEQKLRYEKLEKELIKFKEKLRTWKANDGIDFLLDFALSDEARIFAKDGMGRMATQGFKKFMDMEEVRKNFEKMIFYKFNVEDDIQKNNKIASHDIKDLLDKLDKTEFELDRPKLLTGRLLLMIFTELFTTIADETELNTVCDKLGIGTKDNSKKEKRYLSKHRQIRCMIDIYLKENNLYDEVNELGRARIGWYVTIV